MSLYYVMRPDNVGAPDPVFTRYGRLTQKIDTAMNRASNCLGKVYEVTGKTNELVRSFWVDPKPKARLNSRAPCSQV